MLEKIKKAINLIKNPKTDVTLKNRCIFYLRSLETNESALALQECITNTSVLIDHEVAYALGQICNRNSIRFLMNLAHNDNVDPIVRHEAIEALGNYEDVNSEIVETLKTSFLNHRIDLLRESAILAVDKLTNTLSTESKISKFGSRDPAYPLDSSFNVNQVKEFYLNGTLVQKYQAMFSLRDLGSAEAIDILALGFNDSSHLLRHEVGYVFGQLGDKRAVPYLMDVLEDETQSDVVRHEAAEALGSIGTEEAINILIRNQNCQIQIVRESINVGLKIAELDSNEYLEI